LISCGGSSTEVIEISAWKRVLPARQWIAELGGHWLFVNERVVGEVVTYHVPARGAGKVTEKVWVQPIGGGDGNTEFGKKKNTQARLQSRNYGKELIRPDLERSLRSRND